MMSKHVSGVAVKLIFVLAFFLPKPIQALETTNAIQSPNNEDNAVCMSLNEIGSFSVNDYIEVSGVEVPLYPTFNSPDAAMLAIKTNEALFAVQNAYGLDDLSIDNWKLYAEKTVALLDAPERPAWYTEDNEQVFQLRCFFDIFENNGKNQNIILLSKSSTMSLEENDALQELLRLLLPTRSYELLTKRFNLDTDCAVRRSSGGFDPTVAFEYARKYATNRNTAKYPSFDADCTNFASQILENGGEPQVSGGTYNSVYVGWWHRNDWGTHLQSRSWTVADTFMKYFGARAPYGKDHVKFSFELQMGDFIALDHSNDGDWDHAAYVVTPGNGVILPTRYRDYFVAQHTSDYQASVSDEINKWETYDGKSTYGYFRR